MGQDTPARKQSHSPSRQNCDVEKADQRGNCLGRSAGDDLSRERARYQSRAPHIQHRSALPLPANGEAAELAELPLHLLSRGLDDHGICVSCWQPCLLACNHSFWQNVYSQHHFTTYSLSWSTCRAAMLLHPACCFPCQIRRWCSTIKSEM